MTSRRLILPVLLVGLLLSGCDEGTRDDIADAISSAVDQTRSPQPTATQTTAPEPTQEATPAPTTDATSEPTQASEPTETEAAPAPEPSGSEAESEPRELPWDLILLGLLAFVVLLAIFAVARRRGDARDRRARLRDIAIAEGEWLLGAARERAAGVDASARARDIRMRLDRLNDAVQQLRTGAKAQVVAVADDLQTTARQLSDALVARLDDALAHRDSGEDLGIDELAQRLRGALDRFGTTLGRRR
jgi:hypothetical protein